MPSSRVWSTPRIFHLSEHSNFEVEVAGTHFRLSSHRKSCENCFNEKPKKSISLDSSLPLNAELLNALDARSAISDT